MRPDAYFRELQKRLSPFTEDASYEARTILESVCGLDYRAFSLFLINGNLTDEMCAKIDEIVARREREPLAYILEESWFYGFSFYVSKDCLIPQADTEIVTEKLIS